MALPRVVVFDAYGTLLDVHSAIARHTQRVGPAAAAVSALWRQKQLEYSWILSATGDYEDFAALTDRALGHALATHGIHDRGLRAVLLDAYQALDHYPDAVVALGALRGRGLRLGVLSNGEPRMLAAGIGSAGLSPLLDAVLSVHALRRFKPDPAVYRLATAHFSVQPHEVAFVSANAWDAYGAARFGFRAFWVNRGRGPVEYWLDGLATVLPDLAALPGALGA
ncbi:2-haloacid dehalogenase [Humitalea rosea]|uniref:(S)-2-haloacid dehalogenase n=1 Tax=Humitalea rosea TaxID=990373 RepID=A0A2W7INA6_9PROT|nr:haloacid dehalogenase type II [Humitalea rosea]PZW48796.1 2-haloacid dehalogenase [Humitalea rosea]